MTAPVRIVIADDHPLIRSGMKSIVISEPDMILVGEANNGDDVRQLCEELKPDVLSLDLNMPGPPAVSLVREVRRLSPKTKILIVTAFYDATSVRELISAGASGMLLKDETSGKFVLAVRTVAQGGYWFSPLAVKGLIESPADTARSSNRKLTGREREILILVTQGMSNEQIAEKLELSSQTVRNYISRIYSKLGVRSRTEAVTWAREQGLRSS
ncbi:MAG: response regulator transcription factor [Anaerolineales bacterium]|nr:response regulator transcription factor [Anaerolineales bacterium]